MARGLGFTPVIRAQTELARTLGRGLSRIGDRPLDEAKLGLLGAQITHGIERDRAADERADKTLSLTEQNLRREFPWQKAADKRTEESHISSEDFKKQQLENAVLTGKVNQWKFNHAKELGELESLQVGRALDTAIREDTISKEPLTLKGMLATIHGGSRESFLNSVAQRELQEALAITGASMVEDNDTIKFVKKSGEIADGRDLGQFLPVVMDVMGSNIDPGHKLDQRIREYEGFRSQSSDPMTPEAEQWYQQALKNQKDPRWLIDKYKEQNERNYRIVDRYEQMGRKSDLFTRNIARNDAKIADLESKITTAGSAALKVLLEKIKIAGKKDSKSSWADYLYEVNKDTGMTQAQAAEIVRSDAQMTNRLKAAAEEFNLLSKSLEFMGAEADVQRQAIQEIRDTYGLLPEAKSEPVSPENATPEQIGARYMELRNPPNNMTETEAGKQLLKEGYKLE